MKKPYRSLIEQQQVIDEAKYMLIYVRKYSEPQAYRFLQTSCMDRKLKMHEIALVILKELTQELESRYYANTQEKTEAHHMEVHSR